MTAAGSRQPRRRDETEHDGSELSELELAIAAVLRTVGSGEVLTYGEVAKEAGFPRHARAVGRFLATHDGYPWWRIVNASGRLVPGHEREQSRRLLGEGVKVGDGRVSGMRSRLAGDSVASRPRLGS